MNLLFSMIKEEWRTHSSIFGSFMFALFPVMIMAFSLSGSLLLPIFRETIPDLNFSILAQTGMLLFGLSIGSFGLMGREFMNRRFGHASLIAYSSRTLPVSERSIFANFVIKDIIFYAILWIAPFSAGYGLYLMLSSLSILPALSLMLVSSLWFVFGLSISFFLSTIYANSRKSFVLISSAFILAISYAWFNGFVFQNFSMFPVFSSARAMILLAVSLALSGFSLVFIKLDYKPAIRSYSNSFSRISKMVPSDREGFLAKDFLDLGRSEGGVGKIIFSFMIPIAMVWVAISVLMKIVPQANLLPLFGIFLGVMSSTIYNWLTEFDIFTSYSFLPVKVSDVIKSKIRSYAILNIISIAIMFSAAFVLNQFGELLPSLICTISISAYCLSVLIFLSGLYPNILLYNPKIFAKYVALNSSMMLFLIFSSLLFPNILYAAPLLFIPAAVMLNAGLKKWDKWEHPSF